MNGRPGGGPSSPSETLVGLRKASAAHGDSGGTRSCCPWSPSSASSYSSSCSMPFICLLLLTLLLPLVMPTAAGAVPHVAPPQRPQYIEAIRPVLSNAPMGGPGGAPQMVPPQQYVIQQVPDNVPPPRKRAAIVLDKLMFALQKALDDTPNSSSTSTGSQQDMRNRAFAAGPMDLQRRGNNDGRLYWRCYFNAVSCF